jgi:hypothetical protein
MMMETEFSLQNIVFLIKLGRWIMSRMFVILTVYVLFTVVWVLYCFADT